MTKKREYTREIHIERLAAILSSNKTLCNSCPAAKYYRTYNSCSELWTNDVCRICKDFVGVKSAYRIACPCIEFGDKRAFEITIEKMEEEGYTVW